LRWFQDKLQTTTVQRACAALQKYDPLVLEATLLQDTTAGCLPPWLQEQSFLKRSLSEPARLQGTLELYGLAASGGQHDDPQRKCPPKFAEPSAAALDWYRHAIPSTCSEVSTRSQLTGYYSSSASPPTSASRPNSSQPTSACSYRFGVCSSTFSVDQNLESKQPKVEGIDMPSVSPSGSTATKGLGHREHLSAPPPINAQRRPLSAGRCDIATLIPESTVGGPSALLAHAPQQRQVLLPSRRPRSATASRSMSTVSARPIPKEPAGCKPSARRPVTNQRLGFGRQSSV